MKNQVMVSLIVPVYNSAKYIERCLNSCANQAYEGVEVIAIDDGSTDDSLAVMERVARKMNGIRVFHTKNYGVSHARNFGIKKAKGKYICFVDADDHLKKDFVANMVPVAETENVDFCIAVKNQPTKIIDRIAAERLLLGQKLDVGCWNKMYRKDLIAKIQFDERLFYGEGLRFIMDAAKKASRIAIVNANSYCYNRGNATSATTKADLSKMKNGEKALLKIRKDLSLDKKLERIWRVHYCLFCMNAMATAIQLGRDYKTWRAKFLKHFCVAMRSCGSFRTAVKLVIALITPRTFSKIISNRKQNRLGDEK